MKTSTLNQENLNLERAERRSVRARSTRKMTKEDGELLRQKLFGIINEETYQKSLSKPLVQTLRYADEATEVSNKTKTTHTMRKGLKKLSDSERKSMGLVLPKEIGVEYSLMADGSKVCRCCQSRKPAKFFSNQQSQLDGKLPLCKDCDSLGAKNRRAAKIAKI